MDYPKALFFGLLMTVSIIGLLLLKYYPSLRVILFYTAFTHNESHLATHIYIKDSAQDEEIVSI